MATASTNPRRAAAKKTKTVRKKPAVPRQVEDTPDISTVAGEAITTKVVPEVKYKRLTQDDIKRAKDMTEEEHVVPEWEGTVLLRSLSMRKLLGILDSQDDTISVGDVQEANLDLEPAMKEMVQGAVIDPVVSDEDFEEWMEHSASAVMGIFQKILKISKLEGMTKDGKSKSVEEEVAQFREA